MEHSRHPTPIRSGADMSYRHAMTIENLRDRGAYLCNDGHTLQDAAIDAVHIIKERGEMAAIDFLRGYMAAWEVNACMRWGMEAKP